MTVDGMRMNCCHQRFKLVIIELSGWRRRRSQSSYTIKGGKLMKTYKDGGGGGREKCHVVAGWSLGKSINTIPFAVAASSYSSASCAFLLVVNK